MVIIVFNSLYDFKILSTTVVVRLMGVSFLSQDVLLVVYFVIDFEVYYVLLIFNQCLQIIQVLDITEWVNLLDFIFDIIKQFFNHVLLILFIKWFSIFVRLLVVVLFLQLGVNVAACIFLVRIILEKWIMILVFPYLIDTLLVAFVEYVSQFLV